MGSIKEEAQAYEPKQINNISELESVSTDLKVMEEAEADYPYKYVEIEGKRYKVPASVLAALKSILEENPKLMKFKVKKAGEGLNTNYTVIPLG